MQDPGSSEYLVDSLKASLGKAEIRGDLRFMGGTESATNYVPWGEGAYGYKSLPAVYRADEPQSQGAHLHSRSGIFPRLHGSVEEVKAKLSPVHTELTTSLKALDRKKTGFLDAEAMQAGLKQTGVFLSKADVDTLLMTVPRNVMGQLGYTEMLDALIGKGTAPTLDSYRPPVAKEFQWPDKEDVFVAGLRLRMTSQPFTIPAANMKRYAKQATDIRRTQHDAEKVHDLLRHFMLQDLIISPGRPGHPDLAFRQWLMLNGVLARSETQVPGVVPPEVYEVFDQIIAALGVPTVLSATMTPTPLGSSLQRTTLLGATGTQLSAT